MSRGIRNLPAGPDPRNPVVYQDAPDYPGYKVGSDRSVWSTWPIDGAPPGGWTCIRPVAREGRPPEVPLLRAPGPRRLWVAHGELVDRVFPPRPAEAQACAPFAPQPEVDRIGGRVKLNEEKVAELRKLKAEGWTYPQLARRFGIARSTVHYALNGCTWRHVPRPDAPPRPVPPPAPKPEPAPRAPRRRTPRLMIDPTPTSGPGSADGVTYRPIPGIPPRFVLGSDRSVWARSRHGVGWRRRKLSRPCGGAAIVGFHLGLGRYTSRTLNSLMQEVFPEWAARPAVGCPAV